MYKVLLYILFFSLPLIHTKLFNTLGIPLGLSVSGNFEFTKVMFFQILSGLILGSFFIEKIVQKQPIVLPKKVFFILGGFLSIIILSTFFSLSPYISLFGNGDKSHSFLMFLNVIGLFIVLYNTDKKYLKNIFIALYLSLTFVCIMALKEYFLPTFDYGNLASRAIGTFGHPNYLALFLVMFFPLLTRQKKFLPLLFLCLVTLVFTKSILGIVSGFGYLFLSFLSFRSSLSFLRRQESMKKKKYLNSFTHSCLRRNDVIYTLVGMLFIFLILFLLPSEKLHSFLSRFYIWETTLRIILSDWRIFLFGGGLETLDIYFNSFKSPYLYIFENFGFTADRPHNFFLNIFYHTGILGLSLLFYILFLFGKNIKKHGVGKYEEIVLLFFVFTFFNYPSVVVYLFGVLVIVSLIKKHTTKETISVRGYMIPILILCIFGAFSSVNIYRAEVAAYGGEYKTSITLFPSARYYYELGDTSNGKKYDPLPSERYYKTEILKVTGAKQNCETLTKNFPSVENYFYCGKILERLGETEVSLDFYKLGLSKLPDLWNDNSEYWDNYFITDSITGNRFFSKKFSDVEDILEKTQ